MTNRERIMALEAELAATSASRKKLAADIAELIQQGKADQLLDEIAEGDTDPPGPRSYEEAYTWLPKSAARAKP